ncbi:MAG: hypothetical protein FJ151_01860, partial [Euryarchaeota archaeon]|nr:hypothetical protein [Euryarchaeota archaeon]
MAMSGLEVLQDIDWGTHLCQFYGSRQEYLEVIVPFFSAGFERNHLCLLMASEELGIEEVLEFLRGRLEGIEARMEKGQIEVVSRKEIPTGRLAEFLSDRLRLATENGFSGIRLALDVRPKSEEEFMAVFGADDAIEHVIQGRKIVALCSFCSVGMGPLEIIGVIGRHRIALVRRGDRWLSLESPKLTGTEAALAELRSQATIDDKVRGLVVEGIFRDITNRKRAEDAVTQLNDVLKLINKTMRHDILNELTVISGSLEVFADTRSEKFLANARRAVERCVELTKRMKELESFVS